MFSLIGISTTNNLAGYIFINENVPICRAGSRNDFLLRLSVTIFLNNISPSSAAIN